MLCKVLTRVVDSSLCACGLLLPHFVSIVLDYCTAVTQQVQDANKHSALTYALIVGGCSKGIRVNFKRKVLAHLELLDGSNTLSQHFEHFN